MRNLIVNRKTGFKITDPTIPVNIRDHRGIMFYTTEPIMPVYEFNLPAGNYMVDSGFFKPMFAPIEFKKQKLPIPENFFSIPPYGFEIMFADNPNKCTIFWKERTIVFDKQFLDVPLPDLFFIYFHEIGHSKFGYETRYTAAQSEAYCDLFSSNKMLDMGFNPSQIMLSPKNTLSSKQEYRKNFIENTLLDNAYL